MISIPPVGCIVQNDASFKSNEARSLISEIITGRSNVGYHPDDIYLKWDKSEYWTSDDDDVLPHSEMKLYYINDLIVPAEKYFKVGDEVKLKTDIWSIDTRCNHTIREIKSDGYLLNGVRGQVWSGVVPHCYLELVKSAAPKFAIPTRLQMLDKYPVGTEFRPIDGTGEYCPDTFIVKEDWKLVQGSEASWWFESKDDEFVHEGYLWKSEFPDKFARQVIKVDEFILNRFVKGDVVQVCDEYQCNGKGWYTERTTPSVYPIMGVGGHVGRVIDHKFMVNQREWYYKIEDIDDGYVAEHALEYFKRKEPPVDTIMDKLKEFADAQREIAFKQIGSEMMFKSKVKRVPFKRI